VEDPSEFQRVLQNIIEQHGASAGQSHELILFPDALDRVARICRALRVPTGCALLIGNPQSGRRSLARLASFLSDMTAIEPHSEQSRHHQPSLLHWRGKVKDALKLAGGQSSSAALLFGDADLGDDALCADIYSLLSTGAIPQMWASEERATVMEIVQEVERAEAK
ncbi:unnamed protein product, partial [Polarella glacialis]